MRKTLDITWQTLLYIWQFPQNLLGLALLLWHRGEVVVHEEQGRKYYYVPKMSNAISLGRYILLGEQAVLDEDAYDHEYGHTVQSLYLGWLYLPVIGLCSGIHCWTYKPNGTYYNYWTESWANRLGGVPYYKGFRGEHSAGKVHTIYTNIIQLINK